MKTIYKLSALMLAVAFTACQNEMDSGKETIELNEIVIADGVIKSPQWLVQAYDSISRSHNPLMPDARRYVPVYSVRYGDQEYILLVDGFNSSVHNGHFYYTLSGEQVDKSSDLFEYFIFNEPDERNPIWYPGGTQTSVTTKAWIPMRLFIHNDSLIPTPIRTEELKQQQELSTL